MLQGELMLAHLTQDGADVQMDIRWVQYLKAIVNALITVVKIIVLDLKSLLEVGESRSKLLGSAENAREIIVRHSSVFVSFFGQSFSFSQKFKGDVEVF